jgi:hypothetical protein
MKKIKCCEYGPIGLILYAAVWPKSKDMCVCANSCVHAALVYSEYNLSSTLHRLKAKSISDFEFFKKGVELF